MNRCDECKHKDGCVCVPYGCECFELDLEEHDAQIRADAIEEVKESINEHLFNSPMMNPIMTRNEILLFLEQLKEQK